MAALVLSLMLLALSCGVLPLPLPTQGLCALGLMLGGLIPTRRIWSWRQRGVLLAVLLLSWLWGLQGRPHATVHDPVQLLPPHTQAAAATLQGRLLSDPQLDPGGGSCRVLLQGSSGRSELRFAPCPPLREGWRVRVEGSLQRPHSGPHPLLSGAAERLARQGVWSQLTVAHWQVLQQPATPVADLRRHMAAALIRCGGSEAGGVLAALVVGSAVVPLPLAVREAFRAAGLSHALAASGFHLTVLLGAVMAIGRFGPRPLRWALAMGAMGLFLLLAGPQPSVVRAVAMAALAFLIQECGRRVQPLGVLLVCVLATALVAPAWLLDVGFQLSVAATAGLLLSAGPLQISLGRGLPPWAAEAVAVPLAASLWTLPLQLLHFGALPLYAVAANLLAAPLLSPLTLGAMAMAVAAVLMPALVPLLGWLLVPLTKLFIALACAVAKLPMAQWQLGRPASHLVVLLSLSLLPWLVPSQGWPGQKRWRLGAILLLALVVGFHLAQLRADQLLLVHEGARDLLVARHAGRGALISRRGDGLSCGRARQLALGLGLQRYDWVLLLDAVAPEQPSCWAELTPTLMTQSDGGPALHPGQRLASPQLSVTPLSADSQALLLNSGHQHWILLPDRQSWWSWRSGPHNQRLDGLWLGFRPSRAERRELPALPPARLWLTAAGSGSGWRSG